MEINSRKSDNTLELDRVLQMLSESAVSDAAKQDAMELAPSDDAKEVGRRLAETDAARNMIGLHGSPSFSGIRDIGGALKRADIGGMLNTRELLDVAALLRIARAVKDYSADTAGSIDHLFKALKTNRFLEEKITTAIVSEDEISDAASSALADIRRHIRTANAKIRETLQKFITSPNYAKYLQDPIITMRADRHVLPVKAEHRSEINGLVHDVSSSGATYFIEPMSVVQLNNDLRERQASEQKEIERILAELSADVSGASEDIRENYRSLVALDLIFAKGKLSYKLDASTPEIRESGEIYLKNARHPLLDIKTAVPITVRLGFEYDTLVITGPNTGGKTVALKTLGLLVLMCACGLHIPVSDGSRVSVFKRVFADIGDEQSIEQSLSTFSSHMKNIVNILGMADDRSLILFDELGAGTDPVEGAALAVAIIQHARGLGAKIAATTHYAELKMFAMTTPGVENASCEFDVETLKPTYRLIIGIPGKSNAFAISKRLGLEDNIIDYAGNLVRSEDKRFEDVLAQLEQKRSALEREQLQTEKLRIEAEEYAKKAQAFHAATERERAGAADRARAEARKIIADARAEADTVMEELRESAKMAASEDNFRQINEARASLRRRLNEAEAAIGGSMGTQEPVLEERPIKPGDVVVLAGTNTAATVLQGPDKDGMVSLQAGIMKVTVKSSELRHAAKKEIPKTYESSSGGNFAKQQSSEVDLRGMTSDEAISVMEMFIDNAFRAKLTGVSIIHGKGTGALRTAVHGALRKNKLVKSFRLGRYGEGESGVTIVEIN